MTSKQTNTFREELYNKVQSIAECSNDGCQGCGVFTDQLIDLFQKVVDRANCSKCGEKLNIKL